MLTFPIALARLTARRTPRRLLREVGIGVTVGVGLGMGVSLSVPWTFLVVAFYLFFVQAVGMTENDVFFDFRDLRRLGFRDVTPAYRLAYIAHYVSRDLYVANGLALAIPTVVLVVAGKGWLAVLLVELYLAALVLLTSHVHLAFRISSRARTTYLLGLFLPVPLAAGLHLAGVVLPADLVPLLPVVLAAATTLHVMAVDAAARRLRGNGLSSYSGRRYFAWVLRISPHLFKDLLLFRGLAVQNLVMGVALFALLAFDAPKDFIAPLVLLAVCHDNLFLARKDKAYRLVREDNLFRESVLPEDRWYLRHRKLLTLAVDVPVKLVVGAGLLLVTGGFRAEQVPVMVLVVVTGLVLDAPLPYRDSTLSRVLRSVLKYSVVVLFLLVAHFGWPLGSVVGYSAVLLVLYGVDVVSTYVRPGVLWSRRGAGFGIAPGPRARADRTSFRAPEPVGSAGTEGRAHVGVVGERELARLRGGDQG
ncbi:MAG: hypothetical protein KDB60_04100 [Propionibacteriaceae bacterium]|nr:hypothetical protein [Propionibacteriaceae bacterium]